MVKYRTVRPEMGAYYYTRSGSAAYVAYAMESGLPLPVKSSRQVYARAMGFVFGCERPVEWNMAGSAFYVAPKPEDDLVERITMECAFQYPKRHKRPKQEAPQQMGLLPL